MNGIKKRMVCLKEFHGKFNPFKGNNADNSITSHALSIVLINSTIDSHERTYLVAIRHKHKENMIIKTHFNNTLNEMMNPNNSRIFCSTELKEFIGIIVHPCSFVAD